MAKTPKVLYSERFKDFLLHEKIYLEVESYWEGVIVNIIGNTFEGWVDNYYANGKKIMDGNPIFSFKTKDNFACRIIVSRRDAICPALMSWNASYNVSGLHISEIVITIQPYKKTFDDAQKLIAGFLKGVYKRLQSQLNFKYSNLSALKRIEHIAKVFNDQHKFARVNEDFFVENQFDMKLFKRMESFVDKIQEYNISVNNKGLSENYNFLITSLNEFKKVVTLKDKFDFSVNNSKNEYINEIIKTYSSVRKFTFIYNSKLENLEAKIEDAKSIIEID